MSRMNFLHRRCMAQLVKSLLASGRPEANPQNPHKKLGMVVHTSNPSNGEVQTGSKHWPSLVRKPNEILCLKQIQ